MEVIGLMSRVRFLIFPRKEGQNIRGHKHLRDANIQAGRAGTVQQAGTVRQRRRPYKLSGSESRFHLRTHGGEATPSERELFSRTEKESEVGDSAEPK
jgi:hypothetical protein